ncbi:MAG: RNA polymerase sigma factor [Alloprevotella sp.]
MDEQTYISLVPDVRHAVLREAVRYLTDEDDAADAAQEVMLKLWQLRGGLSDDKKMLFAYAAVVCRNLCLNRLKEKRRHPLLRLNQSAADEKETVDEGAFLSPSPSPDVVLEAGEAYRLCQQAVEQLPEKWRLILQMRSEQQMESEDIARVLGTSAGAVRGMLSKARARLLTLIQQQYEIRRSSN